MRQESEALAPAKTGYRGTVAEQVIRSGDSLPGDYDIEADVAVIPASSLVKGVFFQRLVELLGSDWRAFRDTLETPPRGVRYLPFHDYSQADYTRLAAAAARKRHPGFGLREAMRRLAREDFSVFGATMLGRVMLTLVGDARGALLKAPFIYKRLAPGDWKVEAREVDEHCVRLDFSRFYGHWEYVIGQFEGVVLHYGKRSLIRVHESSNGQVRFDIEHAH